MPTRNRKYAMHFEGKDNAGVRKQIRELVSEDGGACGPFIERRILALANRIALTNSGLASLKLAAEDYRAMAGNSVSIGCECNDCVAYGLQYIGAYG